MAKDKGKTELLEAKGGSQGPNQELEDCLHRIDRSLLQQDQNNLQFSSQVMNLQISFDSLLAEIKRAKNTAIEENVPKEIIDDHQGKNQELEGRLLLQEDQIIQELASQMMDLQSSINSMLADDTVSKNLRMDDSTIHQEIMASKGCCEGETGGSKDHFSAPVTRTDDEDRGNFLTPLARTGEYFTKNASMADWQLSALGPSGLPGNYDGSPVASREGSSSSSVPLPIICRAISSTHEIDSQEIQNPPAPWTSQGSKDTGDTTEQSSAHHVNRINSLQQCASLMTELVQEVVANGGLLEALSIQLVILAIWKQAYQICNSQVASATEGSHLEVGVQEGTEVVPSSGECHSSIDSPLSEAFRSQISRNFIAEIDFADKLAKEVAQLGKSDGDMPDAIEMIFQSALAFGRNGAVHEMMENMERAASWYSKSICLLHFLLMEASSLDCKLRFSLTDANRRRLHSYIDKLRSRHDHCKSQWSDPSPK